VGHPTVAKTKKTKPVAPNPAEALAQLERPTLKWKAVAQIAGAFVVLWVTAGMLIPYVGYWGVGIVGALTLVALGFGLYVWRMTRRSQSIVDIMKGATDDAGRERAIEQLAQSGGRDAMMALARAQLVAQSDPKQALEVLESIDLKKAPAVVQDDVRAQRALLYLQFNRPKDARVLADEIRLDRQPNPKGKALAAAVVAESFARTGKAEEANKLLETYAAEDPAYAEVAPLLLRAQVFTAITLKKRGVARKALEGMAAIDPNTLGAFMQRGAQPEVAKLARQVLMGAMGGPKMKVKRMR
jgi:hypothetical protein